MKLDSARWLKRRLLRREAVAPVSTVGALPTAARPFMTALPSKRPVVPVAIGLKGGKGDFRIAVRVQRVIPGLDGVLQRIRAQARGEVEIRHLGEVKKQTPWHLSRNRPLRIGGSVGHVDVTAGTLGCFVTEPGGGTDEALILSNNHVLADENRGRRGDRVLQPGSVDGGRSPKDVVARLERFVRLKKRGNVVDAAVAAIEGDLEYYYDWIEGLGVLAGVRSEPLEDGETVYKLGRTTGLTRGRVSAIEVDELLVGFDGGELEFDGQFEIEPDGPGLFSAGGDSGALVVDAQRRAVGLLFAGNDADATLAHPIGEVLERLGVDLLL